MKRGAALTGALLATLDTPATWPIALAAFLVRGGLVLVVVPIVVLPTPVGFGNVVAPALGSIAFGSVSTGLIVTSVVLALAVVASIVLGGWIAAALDAEAAWLIASKQGRQRAARGRTAPVAARILLARLVASIPLAVVLTAGTARVVLVTYRELTSPLDTVTPIVVRVLRATPEVVVAVVIAWTLAEMVGAIAGRRIALAGDGVRAALRGAVATGIRQPIVSLVRFWLPTAVLLAVVIPCGMGAAWAWSAVEATLDGVPGLLEILLAVGTLVVVWLVGLTLIAVVSAWRGAIWTVAEVAREGTFGGSTDRRSGDWRADRSSATL